MVLLSNTSSHLFIRTLYLPDHHFRFRVHKIRATKPWSSFISCLPYTKKKSLSLCSPVIPQLRTEEGGSYPGSGLGAVREPEEMSFAIGKLEKKSSVCNLKEIRKRLDWASRVGSSWLPYKGIGCCRLACGQGKWGTPIILALNHFSEIIQDYYMRKMGENKMWWIFKPKTM